MAGGYSRLPVYAAHNKKAPIEILSALGRDSNVEVRISVAAKNKLSEELIGLLARDPREEVRERIAYNKNVPRAILESLSHDSCERVSKIARTRLDKVAVGKPKG